MNNGNTSSTLLDCFALEVPIQRKDGKVEEKKGKERKGEERRKGRGRERGRKKQREKKQRRDIQSRIERRKLN